MQKILALAVLLLFVLACRREQPYDYYGAMKGYIMEPDTLTGDTGITWRCPEARLTLFGWNPDSNRYEPADAYTDFKFTNQWLHFKKGGVRGGSYTVTDSLGRLLRIARTGSYENRQGNNRFAIGVQFMGDSVQPWLALQRGEIMNRSKMGRSLWGFSKHRNPTTEYFVEITLTQ